jgi:hypothetical protein
MSFCRQEKLGYHEATTAETAMGVKEAICSPAE